MCDILWPWFKKCNKEKIRATEANKVNQKKGPTTSSEMAPFKGQDVWGVIYHKVILKVMCEPFMGNKNYYIAHVSKGYEIKTVFYLI